MKIMNCIIVGGGPAGLSAALYLKRNGIKDFAIFEKNIILGGQIVNTQHLENFPTIQDISGEEFAYKFEEQLGDVNIHYMEEVQSVIKIEDHFRVITNVQEYETKTIILANGRNPNKLGFVNEDKFIGNGVYFCATCDGPLFKGKETCLLGDGPTALQYVLQLSNYSSKVKMFTLTDKLFGEVTVIDKVRSKSNIEIIPNTSVVGYIGDKSLEGLKLSTGEIIKTDNLFLAIGQHPNNDCVKGLCKIANDGYIESVNEIETNIPGLFTAGDCRTKSCRQVVTACGDGAAAAMAVIRYL